MQTLYVCRHEIKILIYVVGWVGADLNRAETFLLAPAALRGLRLVWLAVRFAHGSPPTSLGEGGGITAPAATAIRHPTTALRSPSSGQQTMTRKMTPTDAVNRFIEERRSDLSDSTIYNYRSNLRQFIEWCDGQEDIDHVNDLDQFHVSDFKLKRRDEDGVNNVTLYNVMMTFRVFIKWCESRGLLEGIAENIMLPDRGRTARDEKIEPERAQAILRYLDKYHYATMQHALFALLWDTGFRLGTVRALDLDDYHLDEMYVETRHRPDEGTPLKNEEKGERQVNLHEWVCTVLDDYISGHRSDVTDDHGREPLLTTEYGRPVRTTFRKRIRALTRPCEYADGCPVGRDTDDCRATKYNQASKCPESIKPHSVRRSAITAWLDDGQSKELISDRMDVSKKVLDKHYDARSEDQKRKLRREMFEMDSG